MILGMILIGVEVFDEIVNVFVGVSEGVPFRNMFIGRLNGATSLKKGIR